MLYIVFVGDKVVFGSFQVLRTGFIANGKTGPIGEREVLHVM